jgi:Ti-type conjugative transfer relaxase TraA
VDEKTGEVYNFTKHGGSVHHEMLLPAHVDKKFKNTSELMNAIEHIERKDNSQLLKEYVLALPDDKNISLEMKKEMINEFIKEMKWIEEGLAVQVDIHSADQQDNNSHVHLLVPTRRFTEDGQRLGAKARDLEPQVRGGRSKTYVKSNDEVNLGKVWTKVQNRVFKNHGLEIRVDAIGKIAQEHIGAVRMRSVMNEAVYRNEEVVEANIKYLNSGVRLLENVTRHLSVFNKADLERGVKIISDKETRDKLVEDALDSKSLISLHDTNGKENGYFTTYEIRSEEDKLLRLSSYIVDSKNSILLGGTKAVRIANELIADAKLSLTEEQGIALSHLLMDNKGLRILRGRAGTGKSYVLGKVGEIARCAGVNVIGLAPTHKARGELAKVGYEENDTIKGMLFKLQNGRFDLPKYSLLVVDEAGMVGNDDYQELMRVASASQCNVILSGDEKQLASVQRGGMFEVFAEKYGSTSILNIQRQKEAWGRDVAMAFSNGEVRSGIAILQEQNKIVESSTKDESMQGLLADWSKSKESISDRLIIAVTNRDVNALNHGARQYLKLSGDLSGEEVSVAGNYYMKGDRILIKNTDKKLGLVNGDFATIIHASKERFVISMEKVGDVKSDISNDTTNDKSNIVEFDPSAYSGFRHGYATTVFKAQGASILDVFVFHNGFAGIRNSYVALSRNVKNLRLYINNEATESVTHLIKQLGHDPEIGSSLSYFTKQDLLNKEVMAGTQQERGLLSSMLSNAVDFTKNKITTFSDKHFVDNAYYKYEAPKFTKAVVENVLDIVAEELEVEALGSEIILEERAVVGGHSNQLTATANNANKNRTNTYNVKQTAKERFYAKADRSRNATNDLARKAQWNMESEHLRSEVKFKTEAIARDLLGEPNKHLSNGKTLRFGEHGKIAVRIGGERMGSWFDFSSDKGGDMFALVQDRQGCDFKGAAEYLRQSVGIEASSGTHLKLVHDHSNRDLTEKHIKAKIEEERVAKAKAEQVEKLYSRAKDIGNKSIAYKYLTKHRGLDLTRNNPSNALSSDLKTTGIYAASEKGSSEKGKYVPALVAFARDAGGNVTGGQQIFLDKTNANKADIAIPKKSFGKIAGSFVNVSDVPSGDNKHQAGKDVTNSQSNKVTIIAEGLETAMSVRQGISEHNKMGIPTKILCSLGISNIKNYQPKLGEKIIIAADNDGVSSNTNKTIENAKSILEQKGAYVAIVQPTKEGDFNDVLKLEGGKAISDVFKPALTKHAARTLEEYFSKDILATKLDDNDKSNLAYIEKYSLPQSAIVDAYRSNELTGKLELESTRKGLEMAANNYNNNKEILEEMEQWGYQSNDIELTKSLIGFNKHQSKNHYIRIRDNSLSEYLTEKMSEFKEQKLDQLELEKLKPIIITEQAFLKETYKSLKTPVDQHSLRNQEYLKAGQLASEKPETLKEIFNLADKLVLADSASEAKVVSSLSDSKNINSLPDIFAEKLEYNKCYIEPSILKEKRRSSKNIKETFDLLEKEQDTYANMRGNIIYHQSDKALLEKIEIAHVQKETNGLNDLKEAADHSLNIGVQTESSLQQYLKNSTNVKNSFEKLSMRIKDHYSIQAKNEIQRDINIVEKFDAQQKESNVYEFLSDKKEDHSQLSQILQNSIEGRSLDYLASRLKISEIYNEHKVSNTVLANELKIEMLVMYRISKYGTEESIKTYEQYGLEKTIKFVKGQNVDRILDKLYKQSDILGVGDGLKGQSYVQSIAEDKTTMEYVDEALSQTKKFSLDNDKKNTLLEYTNQRDTNKVLEEFKGNLSERKLLNNSIDNLQKFAKPEDLKDGLIIFKTKGVSNLENYTNTICTNNITDGIEKDFSNIRRRNDVELIRGSYDNKAEYLEAISKDDNIMKYVEQYLPKCRDLDLKRDLMECSNQHGIHKILEEFSGGLSDRKEFKENIVDIQRLGNTQDVKDSLDAFKGKGIDAMTRHTSTLCTNKIIDSIDKDFRNIRRGDDVELIHGSYGEKAEYQTAISKEDNIMKYIKPRSEIGQEITKIQEVDNTKAKDFDFERGC